jgi:hypothetical protein
MRNKRQANLAKDAAGMLDQFRKQITELNLAASLNWPHSSPQANGGRTFIWA